MMPRERIPFWNTSTARWLRNCYYEQIQYYLGKKMASLATFMISAFWHGTYPSYYISFFIVYVVSDIEKIAFKKKFKKIPSIFYYFIFDFSHLVFKAALFH